MPESSRGKGRGATTNVVSREQNEMHSWIARVLIIAGVAIAVASPGRAEEPTFGDLLVRAEAQAAVGHRWAPAGDNMTETVSGMMDIIATATPEQLAALAALLERDAKDPPIGPGAVQSTSTSMQPATGVQPTTGVQQTTGAQASLTPGLPSTGAQPGVTVAPSSMNPSSAGARSTIPLGPSSIEPRTAGQATASPAPAQTVPPPNAAPSTANSFPPTAAQATSSSTAAQTGVTIAPSNPPRMSGAVVPPPAAIPSSPAAQASLSTGQRPIAADTIITDRPVPKSTKAILPHPTPRAAELFSRGQQAELRGDMSGARRFYSSAAEQGSAAAARSLGRLYDPAYLKQTALGGIDPDPDAARQWYERAIAMGDAEAGPLLEALAVRQ
jgi:hypothetical protein